MIRRLLAACAFVFALYSCNGRQTSVGKSCASFHDGSFRMTVKGAGTVLITRKGDMQVETHELLKMTFRVKWLSDCMYTLTPTKETLAAMENPPKDPVATVEIVRTTEKSYFIRETSSFSDQVLTGEMIKVR